MSSAKKQIPEEFKKVIFEFLSDISNTFPEYKNTLSLFLDSNGVKLTTSESEMAETQKQMDEHKKLLDEKNVERIANGLKPLKRLPKKNTVQSLIQISQYVSDDENNNVETQNNNVATIVTCKSILKSGPNKGKQCSCLKIFKDGMCKRHST